MGPLTTYQAVALAVIIMATMGTMMVLGYRVLRRDQDARLTEAVTEAVSLAEETMLAEIEGKVITLHSPLSRELWDEAEAVRAEARQTVLQSRKLRERRLDGGPEGGEV